MQASESSASPPDDQSGKSPDCENGNRGPSLCWMPGMAAISLQAKSRQTRSKSLFESSDPEPLRLGGWLDAVPARSPNTSPMCLRVAGITA